MTTAPPTEMIRPAVAGQNAMGFAAIAERAQKVGSPPEERLMGLMSMQTFTFVLFTAFFWDSKNNLLQRIYSTDQEAYPVGGAKRMQTDAPWPQTVLVKQQPHFCRDRADIAATFSDNQTIFELGCYSQLSMPLVDAGVVIGAINFSGGDGVYTDKTVGQVEDLRQEGLVALKAWIASGGTQ